MNKNVIIAIVAVALVAVVAIAAFAMMNGGGNSGNDKTPEIPDNPGGDTPGGDTPGGDTPSVIDPVIADSFDPASGVLMVFGNANADRVLDSKDVDMVNALIKSGKYSAIADANMDRKIDSKDVSVINALINKRSTRMYYQDLSDGPTGISYPVTSFMGIHQFVLIPMVAIGGMEYMNGYTLSPSGEEAATMLKTLYDVEKNVNTSYNIVDVEKFSSLKVKPKVILTYSKSLSNEAKLEKSGVQIVHLDFNGFKESVSAIRTAGFMIGLAENANNYVKFYEDVIADINEKVTSKLTDSQRKTVMCGYMTNCIDNLNGSYTPMAIAAGGKGVLEEGDTTYKEFNRGDEWILSYNEDFFMYLTSWEYTGKINPAEMYKKSADYFTSLKSYKSGNFVVFNSIMPPALTVSYMAEAMYPELVGEGYGDSVNQKYIETYFPDFDKTFKASDHTYMITYDMVEGSL